MKSRAVIIDLDGTLCNIEHRRHLLESKDWSAFFAEMDKDTVNQWCKELIWSCLESRWSLIFVSGRSEDYREVTERWIEDHAVPSSMHWTLFMRPSGDYRKDAEVKKEIYIRDIEPRFDVIFCVDDRQQVVDQWRELGLVCLQCAKGDY